MTKTATMLQDDLKNYTGHAALYSLSHPIGRYKYVIVSATREIGPPETYIFPARKDGKVLNWGQLPGSYQGGMSHRKALLMAGYSLVSK